MQKEKHFGCTDLCTGIHLHAATSSGEYELVYEWSCNSRRVVVTAAIDKNEGNTLTTQALQGFKLRPYFPRFVKYGQDDGKKGRDHSLFYRARMLQ